MFISHIERLLEKVRNNLIFLPVELVRDIFWLDIHLGVGIICACLPTYRVLLRKSSTAILERYKKYYMPRSNPRSSSMPSRERVIKENQSSSVATSHLRDGTGYVGLEGNEVNLVKLGAPSTRQEDHSINR